MTNGGVYEGHLVQLEPAVVLQGRRDAGDGQKVNFASESN